MNIRVLLIMGFIISGILLFGDGYSVFKRYKQNIKYIEKFKNTPVETVDERPSGLELAQSINQLKQINTEPHINAETKNEILSLFIRLQTTEWKKSEPIIKQIVEKSQRDFQIREFVIYKLIKKVHHNDLDIDNKDLDTQPPWDICIRILGDLEAEEAITYLVEHLDNYYDEGIKFYISRFDSNLRDDKDLINYPAFQAILKLKQKAVPSLIMALRNGNSQIRELAAYALWKIGGLSARRALDSAAMTEKNGRIREIIKNILLTSE